MPKSLFILDGKLSRFSGPGVPILLACESASKEYLLGPLVLSLLSPENSLLRFCGLRFTLL
jgi:hypothetical protein